jgi:HSP20 family protein
MTVSRWDPFQDLLSIQDEMNQIFGRVLGHPGQSRSEQATRAWAPALDITERTDAYVVTVELPGVEPADVDVTLEEGILGIAGERRFTSESHDAQHHRVERRYGQFRRSITLPSQVEADAIKATFANGVLEVVVPKAEASKPRKIEIRGAS